MSMTGKMKGPPAKVERGKDHEVIRPVNVLKRRAVVANRNTDGLDEVAIRRAEQALQALSTQFNGWMDEAARKLSEKHAEIAAKGFGQNRLQTFYRDAHDIRGQAATLGFPLATRVGASLCLLLEHVPERNLTDDAVTILIRQHVEAIRAITREGIAKAEHPVGERLAAELEMISERIVANLNGAKLH
jgi:HPt (histidine-containing phosphotransfer) domain-containing protein